MTNAVENKTVAKASKTPKAPQRDLLAELLSQVTLLTSELATVKAKLADAPVKEKKESKKGQPREGVYYVVLGVPAPEKKTFPPQAITCMKILSRATDPTHVTEAEAMRLLEENKRLLVTRQDSWHVFCYYRAKLIAGDYLKML